jgi:hypothetical protein
VPFESDSAGTSGVPASASVVTSSRSYLKNSRLCVSEWYTRAGRSLALPVALAVDFRGQHHCHCTTATPQAATVADKKRQLESYYNQALQIKVTYSVVTGRLDNRTSNFLRDSESSLLSSTLQQ